MLASSGAIQDRTNSGLDVPQGTSIRRRCSREWATSSSSSRADDSHQWHGVNALTSLWKRLIIVMA
jgi:hypothetical protein